MTDFTFIFKIRKFVLSNIAFCTEYFPHNSYFITTQLLTLLFYGLEAVPLLSCANISRNLWKRNVSNRNDLAINDELNSSPLFNTKLGWLICQILHSGRHRITVLSGGRNTRYFQFRFHLYFRLIIIPWFHESQTFLECNLEAIWYGKTQCLKCIISVPQVVRKEKLTIHTSLRN